MKGKLTRVLLAALLGASMALPGGARPVQAAAPPTPLEDIERAVNIFSSVVNLIRGVGNGISEAQLRAAVLEIVTKVEQAKTQILTHIDAMATAEVRACTRQHVIEFVDIDLMNPTVLQVWSQNATGCAILAESFLRVVTDKGAADSLGLALNVVGPIALAARARAGFRTFSLTETLRTGNILVIERVAPTCNLWRERVFGLIIEHYDCTSHNGDRASGSRYLRGTVWHGTIDQAAVQNQATARTSRAIAQRVLPTLAV
jgi:hypothetical protein